MNENKNVCLPIWRKATLCERMWTAMVGATAHALVPQYSDVTTRRAAKSCACCSGTGTWRQKCLDTSRLSAKYEKSSMSGGRAAAPSQLLLDNGGRNRKKESELPKSRSITRVTDMEQQGNQGQHDLEKVEDGWPCAWNPVVFIGEGFARITCMSKLKRDNRRRTVCVMDRARKVWEPGVPMEEVRTEQPRETEVYREVFLLRQLVRRNKAAPSTEKTAGPVKAHPKDPLWLYDEIVRGTYLSRLEEPNILMAALAMVVRQMEGGDKILFPRMEAVDRLVVAQTGLPTQKNTLLSLLRECYWRRGERFEESYIFKDAVRTYRRRTFDYSKPFTGYTVNRIDSLQCGVTKPFELRGEVVGNVSGYQAFPKTKSVYIRVHWAAKSTLCCPCNMGTCCIALVDWFQQCDEMWSEDRIDNVTHVRQTRRNYSHCWTLLLSNSLSPDNTRDVHDDKQVPGVNVPKEHKHVIKFKTMIVNCVVCSSVTKGGPNDVCVCRGAHQRSHVALEGLGAHGNPLPPIFSTDEPLTRHATNIDNSTAELILFAQEFYEACQTYFWPVAEVGDMHCGKEGLSSNGLHFRAMATSLSVLSASHNYEEQGKNRQERRKNPCDRECWTMPLVGGFSRGYLTFNPPLPSGATSYSPHFTLIGSQNIDAVLTKHILALLTTITFILESANLVSGKSVHERSMKASIGIPVKVRRILNKKLDGPQRQLPLHLTVRNGTLYKLAFLSVQRKVALWDTLEHSGEAFSSNPFGNWKQKTYPPIAYYEGYAHHCIVVSQSQLDQLSTGAPAERQQHLCVAMSSKQLGGGGRAAGSWPTLIYPSSRLASFFMAHSVYSDHPNTAYRTSAASLLCSARLGIPRCPSCVLDKIHTCLTWDSKTERLVPHVKEQAVGIAIALTELDRAEFRVRLVAGGFGGGRCIAEDAVWSKGGGGGLALSADRAEVLPPAAQNLHFSLKPSLVLDTCNTHIRCSGGIPCDDRTAFFLCRLLRRLLLLLLHLTSSTPTREYSLLTAVRSAPRGKLAVEQGRGGGGGGFESPVTMRATSRTFVIPGIEVTPLIIYGIHHLPAVTSTANPRLFRLLQLPKSKLNSTSHRNENNRDRSPLIAYDLFTARRYAQPAGPFSCKTDASLQLQRYSAWHVGNTTFMRLRAIRDNVSSFESNLRKKSLLLPAYSLTGALSGMRPVTADEGEARWIWGGVGMQGREKWEVPEKTYGTMMSHQVRKSGSGPAENRARFALVGGEYNDVVNHRAGTWGENESLVPNKVLRNPLLQESNVEKWIGQTKCKTKYVKTTVINPNIRGRDGVVVRLLASQLDEPGSIFGGVASGFSHVGILLDDAAGWRVFSDVSCFPHPCIPALLRNHLVVYVAPRVRSIRVTEYRVHAVEEALQHDASVALASSQRSAGVCSKRQSKDVVLCCDPNCQLHFPLPSASQIIAHNESDSARVRGANVFSAETEETGEPRENPLTSGIILRDFHMLKSGSDPAGNRILFAQAYGSRIVDDDDDDDDVLDEFILNMKPRIRHASVIWRGSRSAVRIAEPLSKYILLRAAAGADSSAPRRNRRSTQHPLEMKAVSQPRHVTAGSQPTCIARSADKNSQVSSPTAFFGVYLRPSV
ncbi:hypothetical protein PR048_008126 [Dryococelus australis]|uniref:Uncharacterized protein n=1 Tax=Dryococelus australis TaxID=614101 RepID=A0ABQ9HW77_9NEOP|nr:hypothetical protein PR048_008126 [Dryococelus australis]